MSPPAFPRPITALQHHFKTVYSSGHYRCRVLTEAESLSHPSEWRRGDAGGGRTSSGRLSWQRHPLGGARGGLELYLGVSSHHPSLEKRFGKWPIAKLVTGVFSSSPPLCSRTIVAGIFSEGSARGKGSAQKILSLKGFKFDEASRNRRRSL